MHQIGSRTKKKIYSAVAQTPAKAVKNQINHFLNFMKSEKNNLKRTALNGFICSLDSLCASILLDKSVIIYERASLLNCKIKNKIKNQKTYLKTKLNTEYHAKCLKHLSLIKERLDYLCECSKTAGMVIKYPCSSISLDPIEADHGHKVNSKCKFFGGNVCLCGMDFTFCGENCAYATTLSRRIRSTFNDRGYLFISGGESGAPLWGKKGTHKSSVPSLQVKAKERYWKNYRRDAYYDEIQGKKV